MYVLTLTGVTGFAVDHVERKGIEHLCNVHLPEGTKCWPFTEAEYEEMGRPEFGAIGPKEDPAFTTIGKPTWKELHSYNFV